MVIEGIVVHGQQLGRALGFPTANLVVEHKVAAEDGVYLSRVKVGSSHYYALSNLGTNPTVGGVARQLESHLIDYPGEELYGERIGVELLTRLRGEVHFASIEALRLQIEQDLQEAHRLILEQEREE